MQRSDARVLVFARRQSHLDTAAAAIDRLGDSVARGADLYAKTCSNCWTAANADWDHQPDKRSAATGVYAHPDITVKISRVIVRCAEIFPDSLLQVHIGSYCFRRERCRAVRVQGIQRTPVLRTIGI